MNKKVEEFILKDPTQISWDRPERQGIEKHRVVSFVPDSIRLGNYRPFTKSWVYSDTRFNNCTYQLPKIFPKQNADNLVIAITGNGSKSFSCLMSDFIPDVQLMFNGQCFPLKLYEKQAAVGNLFANQSKSGEFLVSDGITDDGLKHFLDTYSGEIFKKEDLFYYIYGILHSTDYREQFQNNLSKELPRIPAVKKFEDLMAFSKAGRKLGDLHINYENVEPYPVTFKEGDLRLADTSDPKSFYRVKK